MGYKFTSNQAENKFKNLKKVYMKYKDAHRQTSAENQHFDYAEQFEDILTKIAMYVRQLLRRTLKLRQSQLTQTIVIVA